MFTKFPEKKPKPPHVYEDTNVVQFTQSTQLYVSLYIQLSRDSVRAKTISSCGVI